MAPRIGQFSIHISSSFSVEGTLADFIIISGLRYTLERGGMSEPQSMFMNAESTNDSEYQPTLRSVEILKPGQMTSQPDR
jgi:hypothetical protein